MTAFEYGGTRFARKVGHVDCAMTVDNRGRGLGLVPTCQFTGPAALIVSTGKGDFYYLPGVGQPATVTISRGRPVCVLAARFREEIVRTIAGR